MEFIFGKSAFVCLVFGLSAAAMACSPSAHGEPSEAPEAGACMMIFPASCPSPAPNFGSDVEPILMRRCYPCHGPGGVEQPAQDLSTYQGVVTAKVAVDSAVFGCLMPPPDAGAATQAERLTILSWILCGAPDD